MKKKTVILLAALFVFSVAQGQGIRPSPNGGASQGDPISGASTLREFIERGDEQVDLDVVAAIQKWGRALNDN